MRRAVSGETHIRPSVPGPKSQRFHGVAGMAPAGAQLRTTDVASTVRTALQGDDVSKFRVGEDEYDIVVRHAGETRETVEDVEELVGRVLLRAVEEHVLEVVGDAVLVVLLLNGSRLHRKP